MKVAVLGGGITGLTAAYYLADEGHEVTVIEKSMRLGGLAQGFKEKSWKWHLDYAYHHLFATDDAIISFAREIGFNQIYLKTPKTDSLYMVDGNYRIFPVDSPKDFLQFPLLSVFERLRAAAGLAVLRFLPHSGKYDLISAEDFTRKVMGENMWIVFFEQLFRKKFGKYAGKVTSSFLWARINKRTRKLGYIKGGFQAFTDYVEKTCLKKGVEIQKGTTIESLRKTKSGFSVNGVHYDRVISTLPTPVLVHVCKNVLPKNYMSKLTKLSYLDALVLILVTDKPLLESTYWLNICTPEVPAMVIAQHTNFADKKYYGGKHIAYVGYYLERSDPMMQQDKSTILKMLRPHLNALANYSRASKNESKSKQSLKSKKSPFKIESSYLFKGQYAQPIFDKEFTKRKPDFITPVEGLYIANLDMTYPYDRGTNFAVSLGKGVAEIMR